MNPTDEAVVTELGLLVTSSSMYASPIGRVWVRYGDAWFGAPGPVGRMVWRGGRVLRAGRAVAVRFGGCCGGAVC